MHKIHIIPHCGNADQYHILQKLIRGKLISNKETTLRSISQESLSSLLSIENKIPNILNSDYVLRDYLLSKETWKFYKIVIKYVLLIFLEYFMYCSII